MNAEAWHVVTNTDPLLDSDEEFMDEHVRVDYRMYPTSFSSLALLDTVVQSASCRYSHVCAGGNLHMNHLQLPSADRVKQPVRTRVIYARPSMIFGKRRF